MPVLKDTRGTITVDLPSFKGGHVILYTDFLISDMKEISQLDDDYQVGLASFIALAKEWNLTDEEGDVAPINEENIEKFPRKDYTLIFERVNDLFEEAQKKRKNS